MKTQAWQLRQRRAAITPLVVIVLPMLLILSAFAINLAFLQLSKTELKIATDLSARATGRTYALTNDPAVALAKANELGQYNLVAGAAMQFDASDMQIGTSVRTAIDQRYNFVPAASGNAVELTGRKASGAPSGPVSGFLATLVGAGTFSLTEASVSTQTEVDIILVFDTSGSMAYADSEVAVYPPGPSSNPTFVFGDPAPPNARWFDAIGGAAVFLTELTNSAQNEHVGLVTYADNPTLEVSLTNDYNQLIPALNYYSNNMIGGGTNIEGGLSMAKTALQSSRPFSSRVVIVMTDGVKTVGGNPNSVANALADEGVLVFTITFSDEADQNLMRDVASNGNGKHFHASTGADLIQVFEEIGRQLPTLITR